jgi:acetylornithine deacetylase/succinyl-diaminopimelate desuccinylase-like protein
MQELSRGQTMKNFFRAAASTWLACLCVVTGAAFAEVNDAEIEAAKNILMDSVAIPTVAGRGRVPELAAYYAGILRGAGFAAEDVVITPIGETATLTATLRGKEPSRPPILLSGHMDVVEANPADWVRDPFIPVEDDGYIFGRGVFDNKFDVAMLITTLAKLKREDYRPRQDVILALSGDEESGMVTTQALAEKYRGAEMVLNSDGGSGILSGDGAASYYMMQAAEKTYVDFQLEYTSPGGHSSRPYKPNAITQLAKALVRIDAYDFPPLLSELTRASLRGMAAQVDPDLGAAMLRVVDDPNDAEALKIIRNNPEYIGQIGTTCVATLVNAGHATNALPQRAAANINCRVFPGVPIEDVQAELARVIDDPAGQFTVASRPSISPASPLREDVMDAVADAVYANYPDLPVIPAMSAYGTDCTHFRAAGIPCYGTAGLFIWPADNFNHGIDERIPVSSIPGALVHWDVLIRTVTR